MTSPSTAARMRPPDARYRIPDSAAPKTAPVSASGGMPMSTMRMMPMSVAQSREYHGPMKTEQMILIRCAMGHMPSMRRMGEITTPSPIIIARNTRRST